MKFLVLDSSISISLLLYTIRHRSIHTSLAGVLKEFHDDDLFRYPGQTFDGPWSEKKLRFHIHTLGMRKIYLGTAWD